MYVRISILTSVVSSCAAICEDWSASPSPVPFKYGCHYTRHLLRFHKLCREGMRHRPHAEKVPFRCLREITVVQYAILYKLTSYITHNLYHIYLYNTTFITINIKIHRHEVYNIMENYSNISWNFYKNIHGNIISTIYISNISIIFYIFYHFL